MQYTVKKFALIDDDNSSTTDTPHKSIPGIHNNDTARVP
jgi:hypothetical protein